LPLASSIAKVLAVGTQILAPNTAESSQAHQVNPGLPKSEWEFRRLLETLPAGAYMCDADGLITYYNRHATQLWGRAPALNDPVDRFCGSFKLFTIDGAPIEHSQCWMALALIHNREFNGQEILIERPDGNRVVALAHANPIHNEAGKLIGAVNVLVDITDRKRSEDALRQADRAKNEFLATLAHELRNPLAPISNAAQILQLKGVLPPDLRWTIEVIDRQTKQMTRLVDDLLDVARITGNKLELRQERVRLAEIVLTAVETSRPLIEACRHELAVSVPPEAIFVHADTTRLSQVISNLLNNAAKYTDPGGKVWLKVERYGSDAVVSVRDNGIGLSAEMLPNVFDMFTQAHAAVDRPQSGLGIGLALVRRLVEMHGGTISAKSAGLGQGSEFVVRLPVVIESTVAARDDRREDSMPTSSLRILVVDDNRDAASTLGMLLRITGNDVRTAHDGEEAVAAYDNFRPDVVLMDIGLPKLNGYQAAEQIRQRPWAKSAVLIALSGWGQDADRERSKQAGFDQHLVKPVDPQALMQMLASLGRAAEHLA
jgi:signal transduction histidine kinase/ActR/RegA family two-component response regulator